MPDPLPGSTLDRLLGLLSSGSREDLFRVSESLVEVAAADVRAQLSDPEDLSRQMREHRQSTIVRVADLATRSCSRRVDELQATALNRGTPPGQPSLCFNPNDLDSSYIERLGHLTLERVLVNAAAPEIQLTPLPVELLPATQRRMIVAIIFDYPLAIGHELYPLWTDAFATGPIAGRSIEVIGVHRSWLNDACQAIRTIIYDAASDVFHEGPQLSPATFDAAILLALGPVAHRDISQRLLNAGIPHINSYVAAAEIADDKWACFERWHEAGVNTPPTCLLEQATDRSTARVCVTEFMRRCDRQDDGWFVQPRHGTEAGGVEYVPASDIVVEQILAAHARIAPTDDAILRPRVGRLRLLESEELRTFDLRLHTCRCDGRTRAESGYLICAQSADEPVVAVSRGAGILRLDRLEDSGLVSEDGRGETINWSTQARSEACDMAARATQVLDLDLAGVDLKFDVMEGRIQPVVLDVNPRPAGLLHADLIDTQPLEPGVGATLWHRMAGA
ncbi:MAG: hypothetical protein HN712_09660 [Gemmatimonadetes bacterium]|nr:hypothetical protein [Gemmatimonadota bacterium]